MPEIGLQFEVAADKDGYEVFTPRRKRKGALLSGELKEAALKRRGGRLITRDPFASNPDLYRRFASASATPKFIAEFMSRYGPLSADVHKADGAPANKFIAAAKMMATIILDQDSGRRHLQNVTRGKGIKISKLDAVLRHSESENRLVLVLTPPSLLEGLWLQLAMAVTAGATFRTCRHCGGAFPVGAGTGRRLDAAYCSDEHRVMFHNSARARRKT